MSDRLIKYPRTQHLAGSRVQPGDEDLPSVSLAQLDGEHLVVEEKLDGANVGIGFTPDGELLLQSRGHFLTGGRRERQFDLLKKWANSHRQALWERLGSRYVAYGEWLYAKHTIFYDRLPHYFVEFDVFDREASEFLSTDRRSALWHRGPVVSVPVLWTGRTPRREDLEALVSRTPYKSDRWRDRLLEVARASAIPESRAQADTDPTDDMEGLYIKVERDGRVTRRLKLVRSSFSARVRDSESHWMTRPILPNQLADEADIFAPSP